MQCKKKKYSITVSVPKLGTKVHNKLENSDYVTNENKPFVLTGLAGEEWTVDQSKLTKTYTFQGKEITNEIIEKFKQGGSFKIDTKPEGPIYFCRKANGKEKIKTSWGETLEANRSGIPHGDGDYVVSTDKEEKDSWIVNGEIFAKTYEIINLKESFEYFDY